MYYSSKPNYGILFFIVFIAGFFVILLLHSSLLGYGIFFFILLAGFFVYKFLKSNWSMSLTDGSLVVSYPWIFQRQSIDYSSISKAQIIVNIQFGGRTNRYSGHFWTEVVLFYDAKKLSIDLTDFCNYYEDQLPILRELNKKIKFEKPVDFHIPIHGGDILDNYVEKVKRLFKEFNS